MVNNEFKEVLEFHHKTKEGQTFYVTANMVGEFNDGPFSDFEPMRASVINIIVEDSEGENVAVGGEMADIEMMALQEMFTKMEKIWCGQ